MKYRANLGDFDVVSTAGAGGFRYVAWGVGALLIFWAIRQAMK